MEVKTYSQAIKILRGKTEAIAYVQGFYFEVVKKDAIARFKRQQELNGDLILDYDGKETFFHIRDNALIIDYYS